MTERETPALALTLSPEEIVALVNAAQLGAAIIANAPFDVVQRLALHTLPALNLLGGEHWTALLKRLVVETGPYLKDFAPLVIHVVGAEWETDPTGQMS